MSLRLVAPVTHVSQVQGGSVGPDLGAQCQHQVRCVCLDAAGVQWSFHGFPIIPVSGMSYFEISLQFLPALQVGVSEGAGERSQNPPEDQTLQDQTGPDEASFY